MDADGGCGLVREASQSVHHSSQTLHCFVHHSKLWLVKQGICGVEPFGLCILCTCIGVPLLYMVVVEPLGFLVNTDNIIGNHYEYRYHNFSNGLLLA